MATDHGTPEGSRPNGAERRRRLSLLLIALGAFVVGAQIVPLVRGGDTIPGGPLLTLAGLVVCAVGVVVNLRAGGRPGREPRPIVRRLRHDPRAGAGGGGRV